MALIRGGSRHGGGTRYSGGTRPSGQTQQVAEPDPAAGQATSQGVDASEIGEVGEINQSGPDSQTGPDGQVTRSHQARRLLTEIAFLALVVLVASFALKTFVIETFWIPSHSMDDTLHPQDRVMVTKLAPGMMSVHRGDIVVFHDPGGWASHSPGANQAPGPLAAWFLGIGQALGLAPTSSEEFLIKRVIGLPGDHVTCIGDGAPVTVNGVALNETYVVTGAAPSSEAFDITVPEGAVWVMGDNRSNSVDSRFHQYDELGGAVALDKIVGVAQFRTWPLSRLGTLRNPGAVFAAVPQP